MRVRARGRREAAALAGLAAVAAAAFLFARHFAVDWVFDDDTLTLGWLDDLAAGRLGAAGLLALWNNQHPVGAQVAATWLVAALFGLDFRLVVALSFVAVLAAAAAALSLGRDLAGSPAAAAGLSLSLALLAFHPIQTEHLLWAFELGWFMVNACVLANALLVERLGPRGAPAAALLCLIASFSAAQGAFAWFAAALHVALRGRGPPMWFASGALAAAGGAAVLRVAVHAAGAGQVAAPAPPSLGGLAIYVLETFGTLAGTRDHAALAVAGAASLVLAAALAARLARGPDPAPWRAGVVLGAFSVLCVLGFARGRLAYGIDWALASFHAAPLLVPFALGTALLVASAERARAAGDRIAGPLALPLALLLATGLGLSWTYGAKRARLWTMDRGYAVWAACEKQVPYAVAVRAAGAEPYAAVFAAAQGRLAVLCPGRLSPLESALIREPALFETVAAAHPEARTVLALVWQDYATELPLQVALDPRRPDTPARLLALAKAEAARGAPFDHADWAPYAEALVALP